MANQHTQFTLDGTEYQISSDCERVIFPKLCDRVVKHLERIGKETAKGMYGEATVSGKTKLCERVVSFKLTINPQGIVL